jgi:hypothetical protein
MTGRIGIVSVSEELINSKDMQILGRVLRIEPSMTYVRAHDVLMESDHFDLVPDNSLIPHYEFVVVEDDGVKRVESCTRIK